MIDTSKIVLIPIPAYREHTDKVAIKTSDISDLFEEIKRLENENQQLRTTHALDCALMERLTDKIDRCREALEWYASRVVITPVIDEEGKIQMPHVSDNYFSMKAREALDKIK